MQRGHVLLMASRVAADDCLGASCLQHTRTPILTWPALGPQELLDLSRPGCQTLNPAS